MAGSVARVRAPSSDHSLTSPPHAPDQPLDLDLSHSVPLGHQGVLQLTEAAGLLLTSCYGHLKNVP